MVEPQISLPVGWELVLLMNFSLFSSSERVGRKSSSVPCTKVPGALSGAGMAVMQAGLEKSGGRWLLISSASPSQQCFPVIVRHVLSPFSITDSSPLHFLPFIPPTHEMTKCRSFQSWQEVILIHEDEFQVWLSLHNLFLIAR